MFRKAITLLILTIPVLCPAQTNREKAALRDLSKHRWDKALSTLEKSIHKDSTNVPAFYVLSQFYFKAQNPAYNLDSAYRYADRALILWNQDTRGEEKQKWSRLPLDSTSLVDLRQEIETAAFEAAQSQGLEESYIRFIEFFPYAREKQAAINLRNAEAFRKAEEENHYLAFLSFMDKYPDAQQIPEARRKYEKLLFEYFTRDQRLESFELFLKDHPETPYRMQAERSIFQLITAAGTADGFLEFMSRYPASRFTKSASDMLYHIYAEERRETMFPKDHLTDSLSAVIRSEKDYLIPFLKNGKFGFMTSSGKEVIPADIEEIDESYICGNIAEDVLVLPGKLVTPRGGIIWSGTGIAEVDDIGYGFLVLKIPKGNLLLHKSGLMPVSFFVRDAKILNGKMLAIKTETGWGIYAFNGRRMVAPEYDDISSSGHVLVLRQKNQYHMSTLGAVSLSLNSGDLALAGPFDEVKRMGEQIWVRTAELQGLLDQDLKALIPLQDKPLSPAFFGVSAVSENGMVTYNAFGEESENFLRLEIKEPWVSAKTGEGWVLYDPAERIYKSVPYDTLMAFGNFAVGKKQDDLEIHFSRKPNFTVRLSGAGQIEFLPGQDSLSFLVVEVNKKLSVYDAEGKFLFAGTFDRLQYAGSGFFVFVKKEKKGLVDATGKTILPAEYDAIGTAGQGMISLLRSMKFGLFDIRTNKLIKPAYEKNIIRFNDDMFTAFKGGGLGFIDINNKPMSGFEFSEVHAWKDSVALVKQDGVFHLYDVYTRQKLLSGITKYKPISDMPEDRLFIFTLRDQVGVLSNRKGVVIPINFSDVINVGSPEKPVYFTEKHVKEASLFVVIYYDHLGRMIRREVYEQDEYEQIYCNN